MTIKPQENLINFCYFLQNYLFCFINLSWTKGCLYPILVSVWPKVNAFTNENGLYPYHDCIILLPVAIFLPCYFFVLNNWYAMHHLILVILSLMTSCQIWVDYIQQAMTYNFMNACHNIIYFGSCIDIYNLHFYQYRQQWYQATMCVG